MQSNTGSAFFMSLSKFPITFSAATITAAARWNTSVIKAGRTSTPRSG